MIEVKTSIGKQPVTLTLPTSWDEVSLSDALDLLLDTPPDDASFLALFCKMPVSQIRELPHDFPDRVAPYLSFLNHPPIVPEKSALPASVAVPGITIVIPKNLDEMTIGEKNSVAEHLKELDETNSVAQAPDYVRAAKIVLSTLLFRYVMNRPFVHYADLDQAWRVIGQMPATTGLSLSRFFLNSFYRTLRSGASSSRRTLILSPKSPKRRFRKFAGSKIISTVWNYLKSIVFPTKKPFS